MSVGVAPMPTRNNGIVLIDKPAGISSAGVVARVKRILSAARVGHAGTLDPDATGLLIILVNGATRVASYAADGWKVYSGEIQLGVTTSTDDLAGDVLNQQDVAVDFGAIAAAATTLCGRIMQRPPKVSAKKLNGKRAYKLHRSGQQFELDAREVEVRRFELVPTEDRAVVRYVAEVSPGTYVRSLARDLGATLGCGGAVKSIRREQSGYFSVADAVSLEIASWECVRDWSELVPTMPTVAFSAEVAAALLNGQQGALRRAWEECNSMEPSSQYVVYSRKDDGESLGILEVDQERGFSFGLNIGQ
jgi:tRNA pseudouridine55 synthase